MHTAAPAPEKVPAGQLAQLALDVPPAACAKLPGEHGVHALLPAAAYEPAAQVAQVAEPATDAVPAWQLWQVAAEVAAGVIE